MTGNTYTKARAVFLAFLMVVSIFGMTAGLAGSAAAAASNMTVNEGELVQPDGAINVSVDVEQEGNSATVIVRDAAETDSTTVTVADGGADDADGERDGVVTTELDLANIFTNTPADGEAIVAADEGTAIDEPFDETATVLIDGTAPEFGYSQPEGTVTTTAPEIVQNISDDVSGVDEGTIHVTITRDSDGEYYTYTIDPTQDNDGVDYANGNLTVQPGAGDVPELEDHSSYTVDVSASDNTGNGPAATSFGFDVDTETHLIEPEFSFDTPGQDTTAGEPTQNIQVGVTSAGDTTVTSANLTVTNGSEEYRHTLTDDNTDVWTDGEGFTVQPGTDIPELPNGTIYLEVNATNDQDNSAEDTSWFEVDNIPPNAEDVSLSNTEIYEGNNADEENVTVTFDEPVDPDSVVVKARDGATVATIDQALAANEDLTQVTLAFDVSDLDATTNESAEVEVVDAQDQVVNSLNQTANTSFAIDTEITGAAIEGPVGESNILSGSVNFTEDVSETNDEDVVSTDYYLLKGGNGDYTPEDDRGALYELETPSHTNTQALSEGRHTFVVYTTDDAGNERYAAQRLTIDNWDVLSEFDGEEPLTGEVDITETFTVYNNGVEDVQYYYAKDPADPDDQSAYIQTDSFEVDEDADYYLAASIPDPGYDGADASDTNAQFHRTGALEGQTLDVTNFDVQSNDEGTVTVNATTDMPLDALHVDYFTNDAYVEQSESHFGLDEFEPVDSDSNYKYTATIEAPRDGAFDFVVKGAEADNLALGYEKNKVVEIDAEDPTLTDATISGADADGRTQVALDFSEPAHVVDLGALEVEGDSQVIGGNRDGSDGTVVVQLDDILQTGNDSEVTFPAGSVDELYGTDSNDETSAVVDTVDLQLSEGNNLVSVPAATGRLDISELDTSNVDAIWAYDDGEWVSYDPDASENDLTVLRGGQGYVFNMDAADEIPVRVYNTPGDTGSNAPAVPSSENVEEGWNLVGHFQEDQQDRDTALTTIGGSYMQDMVIGEAGDGSYQPVASLEPGEGYWLFATDEDVYAEKPFNDAPVVYHVMALDSEDGGTYTNLDSDASEEVLVHASVDDPDGVDTVEFDSNVDDTTAELTDDNGDGTYISVVTMDLSDESVDTDLGDITATDDVGESRTVGVEAFVNDEDTTVDSSQVNEPGSFATADTTETTEIEFDVSGVSADGDSDTLTLVVDQRLADNTQLSDTVNFVEAVNTSDPTEEYAIESGPTIVDTDSGSANGIQFQIAPDEGGDVDVTARVNVDIDYPASDGDDYRFDAEVVDSDGSIDTTVEEVSGVATVTGDERPTLERAETADSDDNGAIDQVNVTFSEGVTGVDAGDYTVEDGETTFDVTGVNDAGDANDETTHGLELDQGNSSSTDETPTVTYQSNDDGTETVDTDQQGLEVADGDSAVADDGAEPIDLSAEYFDTDDDGQVDQVDVTYSEAISADSTIESGDWSFGDTDGGTVAVEEGSSGFSADTVQLAVSGTPENDTGINLTVSYSNKGSEDSIVDNNGNAAGDSAIMTASDGASPTVESITADSTTSPSSVTVQFTEELDETTVDTGDFQVDKDTDGNGSYDTEITVQDTVTNGDGDASTVRLDLQDGDFDNAQSVRAAVVSGSGSVDDTAENTAPTGVDTSGAFETTDSIN